MAQPTKKKKKKHENVLFYVLCIEATEYYYKTVKPETVLSGTSSLRECFLLQAIMKGFQWDISDPIYFRFF